MNLSSNFYLGIAFFSGGVMLIAPASGLGTPLVLIVQATFLVVTVMSGRFFSKALDRELEEYVAGLARELEEHRAKNAKDLEEYRAKLDRELEEYVAGLAREREEKLRATRDQFTATLSRREGIN